MYVVVKEPTLDEEERAGAEGVGHQADGRRARTSGTASSARARSSWPQRIDPLPAPLTPQQQAERPYALGTMEIVPAPDTKFTKQDELSTFLLIYNAKTDATNKPDVTVEYNFYAKQGGARSSSTRRTRRAERADAAAGVRCRRRPPAAERPGRAAGVVPRGRLPARDQGHRQDREQVADARRELHGDRLVGSGRTPSRARSCVRCHAAPV